METERKYLNADLDALRSRLVMLGAKSPGPHFESNVLYDTPDGELFKNRRLLRLREQEWPDHKKSVLTYKYPCANPAALAGQVKAREELELELGDGAIMAAILLKLGYREAGRYEKRRESWRFQPEGADAIYHIDMDTLPFGDVVEIEGDPGGMDAVASALGLDKREISLKTYHELNQEWRKARGLSATGDLLFERDVKSRIRNALGLAR